MAGVKKKKFVPKEKRTLVSAPKWAVLSKATTEEDRLSAFAVADSFAHYEVGSSEQIKALKTWIRKKSDWDSKANLQLNAHLVELPDTYLTVYAKFGWIAMKLGYMPEAVKENLEEKLLPLILNSTALRGEQEVNPAIHPDVSALDDDNALSVANVKEWLKHWSGWVNANRKAKEESKDASERMEFQIAQNYVYNLRAYLHTGIYSDHKYGMRREGTMVTRCFAMARNPDGTVKRNVGTWYPDIGFWTKERATNAT